MLLAEYSWPSYEFRGRLRGPDDWILWHVPLARAFALYAALGARYGVEPRGPTYVQAAMVRAKRAVEEAVERGDAKF